MLQNYVNWHPDKNERRVLMQSVEKVYPGQRDYPDSGRSMI
jgi:hypothetical protein